MSRAAAENAAIIAALELLHPTTSYTIEMRGLHGRMPAETIGCRHHGVLCETWQLLNDRGAAGGDAAEAEVTPCPGCGAGFEDCGICGGSGRARVVAPETGAARPSATI